jgi:release factor-specific protein-(glutamine-N5) methyltransferase
LAVAIAGFGIWQIHNALPSEGYWTKQLIGLGIALFAFVIIAFTDYRRIIELAPFFYGFGLFLLFLVLTPLGVEVNGQTAWLKLPIVGQFQPSEFVKIPTVLMLAKYFGSRRNTTLTFKEMIIGGLILGGPVGLIMLEPDAGQAMTYFPILAAVMFLSAIKIRYVIIALVVAAVFIPTAYIVGVREFWGLEFRVSPAVLIPRPETEFVVEEALTLIRDTSRPRIADIGTGSGNIAISLAYERPDMQVIATDVSIPALAVALDNARRHGVVDRVEFVRASYLAGVDGEFDLIAANPPYVRDRDKPALGRPVRHEPEVALFGGDSGLRDIAGVLDTAAVKLRPQAWLVMEFGFGQEEEVAGLVAERPALRLVRCRADLQGLARTAIVQKS